MMFNFCVVNLNRLCICKSIGMVLCSTPLTINLEVAQKRPKSQTKSHLSSVEHGSLFNSNLHYEIM